MKFHEMTTQDRVRSLIGSGVLSQAEADLLTPSTALPTSIAANMIENQIGAFPVPLGLAEHFIVDGAPVVVPLAVEEPSVIAAAGNAAKRCQDTGGFATSVSRGGLAGQVVFLGQMDQPERFLDEHRESICRVAHDAHPSLWRHGGGLQSIEVVTHHQDGDFVEFRLTIDPGEAMGANVVNTICEAVGRYIGEREPELDLLMGIVSNKATLQRARAKARFRFTQLETLEMSGQEVANRIVQAGRFAEICQERACTQNKGIMNGVSAFVLVTGNDTRNVEAAAYADCTQEHPTWTHWSIEDDCLAGNIDMPMPIGAVGGAVSTLPVAKLAMDLLGNPDASRLMGIAVSVGLASNMAALRALVTYGIQKGHMNLQLRSLAVMAGASGEDEISQAVQELRRNADHADLAMAERIVTQLKLSKDIGTANGANQTAGWEWPGIQRPSVQKGAHHE